jgi:hypothetical protein
MATLFHGFRNSQTVQSLEKCFGYQFQLIVCVTLLVNSMTQSSNFQSSRCSCSWCGPLWVKQSRRIGAEKPWTLCSRVSGSSDFWIRFIIVIFCSLVTRPLVSGLHGHYSTPRSSDNTLCLWSSDVQGESRVVIILGTVGAFIPCQLYCSFWEGCLQDMTWRMRRRGCLVWPIQSVGISKSFRPISVVCFTFIWSLVQLRSSACRHVWCQLSRLYHKYISWWVQRQFTLFVFSPLWYVICTSGFSLKCNWC